MDLKKGPVKPLHTFSFLSLSSYSQTKAPGYAGVTRRSLTIPGKLKSLLTVNRSKFTEEEAKHG